MAALFVADPEIMASHSPLRPVRPNAVASRPEMGEQMRDFVAKGPVNLALAMLAQQRVQKNPVGAKIGAARATAQTRTPFHDHGSGDAGCAGVAQ